jgi:hypothetical protein
VQQDGPEHLAPSIHPRDVFSTARPMGSALPTVASATQGGMVLTVRGARAPRIVLAMVAARRMVSVSATQGGTVRHATLVIARTLAMVMARASQVARARVTLASREWIVRCTAARMTVVRQMAEVFA